MADAERVICDNPTGAQMPDMVGWDGRIWSCTCLECSRCHKHGHSTYGHWQSHCSVSRKLEQGHFCCPGDCELVIKP